MIPLTLPLALCLALFFWPVLAGNLRADPPAAVEANPVLRGQPQKVFIYPVSPDSAASRTAVLYVSGDAGMYGLAGEMAKTISGWGYRVYGLDIKHYLTSFTHDKEHLSERDVMGDMLSLADWIAGKDSRRIVLVGWSEGAGIALLGAAADSASAGFAGLVAIGLSEDSFLAWRTVDDLSFLTHKDPDEPNFPSAPYLPLVAPLPMALVQSTADEYVSEAASLRMFELVRPPKKYFTVRSEDHKFKGALGEFFSTLHEALAWTVDNASKR